MQRLANRDVTDIGFDVADAIENRVNAACINTPELKDALMDYSYAYADSFYKSRGKLPSEQELKNLASTGLDGIQAEAAELPANIKTDQLKEIAAMPMSRAPHLEQVFGENDRLYYKLNMEKPA